MLKPLLFFTSVALNCSAFAQDPQFDYFDLSVGHRDYGDGLASRFATAANSWEVAEPFFLTGTASTIQFDVELPELASDIDFDTSGWACSAGVGFNQKFMNGVSTYVTVEYAATGFTVEAAATDTDTKVTVSENDGGYAVTGGVRVSSGVMHFEALLSRREIGEFTTDLMSGQVEYRLADQFAINGRFTLGISEGAANSLSVGVRYYFD